MALYQNGTLISGANTLPQMTLAEYQALPVSERPTYWERTDLNYSNIPASDVTYGSGSVEDALDNKKYSGTGTTNASGELVLNLSVDDYKIVNMRVMAGADLCHAFPSVSSTGTVIIVVLNRSTSQPMANTSISFDLYYM